MYLPESGRCQEGKPLFTGYIHFPASGSNCEYQIRRGHHSHIVISFTTQVISSFWMVQLVLSVLSIGYGNNVPWLKGNNLPAIRVHVV
jgi:hypothetical protein